MGTQLLYNYALTPMQRGSNVDAKSLGCIDVNATLHDPHYVESTLKRSCINIMTLQRRESDVV